MVLKLHTFKLHLIDLEQRVSPINIGKMEATKALLVNKIKHSKDHIEQNNLINKSTLVLLSQEEGLAEYIELINIIKSTFKVIVDEYKNIPKLIISYKKEAVRWLLEAKAGSISLLSGDEKATTLLLKANQLAEDESKLLKEIGLIKTRIQQQELLFQERRYTYYRLKKEIELYIIALEFITNKTNIGLSTSNLIEALQELYLSNKALTIELNTLLYSQHSYTQKALQFLKNEEIDESTRDRVASSLLEKGINTRAKEQLVRTYRNELKKAYYRANNIIKKIERSSD